MPKPSRTGQNPRRPRVAGLRKRGSQNTGAQQKETERPGPQPVEQAPATGISEPEPTTADSGAERTEPPAPEPADAEPTGTDQDGTAAPEPVEHETTANGSGGPAIDEAADSDSHTHASEPEQEAERGPEEASEAPTGDSGDDAGEPAGSTPPPPLEGDDASSGETSGGRGGYRLPGLLLGLTVVCTVLAVVFGVQAAQLRGDGAGSNQALADAAATSQVNGQISEAVAKVFSYDFADTAKTEQAANELLVGDAVDKYNELFATIKEQAPQQKLVVTTTVKTSAVKLLQDDRAEVLLFVDQNAVRTENGENNIGAAQILIGAEKQGDQWKINQITQR